MAVNVEWIKKNSAKEHQLMVAHNTRNFSGKGNAPALLSLVYHDCGKRLTIGREVYKALGKPERILISTIEGFLVIRTGSESGYKLSATDKGKPILYNAEVVRSLITIFNLEFAGRSTLSFYEGEYFEGAYYIKMVCSEEEPEETDTLDTTEEETCGLCEEDGAKEGESLSKEDTEGDEEDLDELFCD